MLFNIFILIYANLFFVAEPSGIQGEIITETMNADGKALNLKLDLSQGKLNGAIGI